LNAIALELDEAHTEPFRAGATSTAASRMAMLAAS
jgi:hypothetical protein